MALRVFQGERTNTKELHHLANKWNVGILDLSNTWLLKIGVEHSRREYLELKAQHEAYRRKYL